MEITRRSADDLLEVAKVLLLLQGALLVATTVEALVWAMFFPGASGSPALMSGATAVAILVARIRLKTDRRLSRKLVYFVEGLVLLTAAIDLAIGLALAHSLPPMVALLTQFALPIAVIVLLRRSAARPHPTVALQAAP